MNSKRRNKKGSEEIPDTIVWIIATVIIVGIIVFSVYATTFFKGVSVVLTTINSVYNSVISPGAQIQTGDILKIKTMESFLLVNNGGTVFSQIKNDGNLNDFSGNKAKDIFTKLYGKDYSLIWFGVKDYSFGILYSTNKYFNLPPSNFGTGGVQEEIKMSEKKRIDLEMH
jgi:hypothetical protein